MVAVTCIIPCHNHASTIERAVGSAISQADRVVIIDDSSTDNPASVIKKAWPDHERISIIHTLAMFPAGVCHARNLGITMAGGGLILPLDADDTLAEGIVPRMKAVWKPGTFVYGNWMERTKQGDKMMRPPSPTMIRKKNIGYATFLFHHRDWVTAGGYDPAFNIGGEHWGFMAKLWIKHKVKPIYLDEIIFNYDQLNGKRFKTAHNYHKAITRMVGDAISGY